MNELSLLGPLRVAKWRPGRRVPVAAVLTVGDIEIQALEDPRLLLVPANVTYLQQMWDAVRMPTRNNLLITGESGSGKTTLVRYLGEVYRQALLARAAEVREHPLADHAIGRASSFQTRILTFHENLRRSDITERRHYGETGEEKTGWTMSDVMDGMVAGDWNVLSEINRTGEDVQAEFNEPLENKAKTLHQRVIRGHPDSRFIATVNPIKSEGRGIYEGKVMSGEFMNRFTNKVHLHYLPPDQEFEVLKSYGPGVDDTVIERLVALATDIRRDYAEEHGIVPFPVTTRALIRMIRHLQRFPGDCLELRSLFWRKAYWLDDQIHPPVARKLVGDLLDLHDIVDSERPPRERSRVVLEETGDAPQLCIGDASHPLGTGGPYVPDTVIEEVQQNLADLEWLLKDMVLKENILLIGEAGVGKNKLESYLAHLLDYNLLVIGMSGETRVSDLLTYRSFGEDEAGKTGDTATLGLRALTDPEFGWMIVLDEANKAHPGVLVSFNDLLQDRLVRLPGGAEFPVRASICVNINPNRPPYEVNDFSFEFMDRFSIHTIVHLPSDQAVDVLWKKYPDADVDFIRDVVNGFYALHPLYSSGILFEPVTMRNEEAAIERGLQYPGEACNIVDLLCTCYGPRDARELNAIRSTLQTAGFDRNVLAAARALEDYRTSWECDKGDERKALALAETYRAIGKPSAAREVLQDLLSLDIARDWVYHFRIARILLDDDQAGEAQKELRKGFAEGMKVRMDNGEEYVILHTEVRIPDGSPRISVEAQNTMTGNAALIASFPVDDPAQSIRRLSGEYLLSFTDPVHGLALYERPRRIPATPGMNNPDIPKEDRRSGISTDSGGPLRHLVRAITRLSGPGGDFRRQVCQLPSPPWTEILCEDGSIVRELGTGDTCIRLIAHSGSGWSVEVCTDAPTRGISRKIGWMLRAEDKGEFFYTIPGGSVSRIPVLTDINVQLGFCESGKILYLILPQALIMAMQMEDDWGNLTTGDVRVSILSPEAYYSEVLYPLHTVLYPRLQRIFRYARTLSGYQALGTGDILYTIRPDSRIAVSVLVEVDGMGPVFQYLSPEQKNGVPEMHTVDKDSILQRLVIPFPQLDVCEDWQCCALSQETQAYLMEIRGYIAGAFFRTNPIRDLAYEAKARANLAVYGPITGQVAVRSGTISRGDILVRTTPTEDPVDLARSVFIVQFMQEGDSRSRDGSMPVVRGFWLAERNPIATEKLDTLSEHFGLVAVKGDDKYERIIRQLAGSFQESVRPWHFSRSGSRSKPVVRLGFDGFDLEYHPMDRRFGLTITQKKQEGEISIQETGYPAEATIVNEGTREVTRWTGRSIIDIQYHRDPEGLIIILDDDFLSCLVSTRVIGDEPLIGPGGIVFDFITHSEAGRKGLIPKSGAA